MKKYQIKNGFFCPYSFSESRNPNPHFDYRPVNSFGTKTVVVIGARRIGKTYGAKMQATERRLYKKIKLVWLRDNDEARKKISMNHGKKFFSDYLKTFNNVEGKIDGELITLNNETFGYLQPTSTFQNYKGNDYNEIGTIVYDEFIPEHGKVVRGSRVWEFINSLYTILSTRRNAKAILLANALNSGDEILGLFGLKIRDYGLYVNRAKDVAIHYCDNHPDFNKMQESSIVGKWIKGTVYEDNLFHNKFADDTTLFFDVKPPKCALLCILHDAENSVRVYVKDTTAYVTHDFNKSMQVKNRFTIAYENVNSSVRLLPPGLRDGLRNAVKRGDMRYENAFVKNLFLNVIK